MFKVSKKTNRNTNVFIVNLLTISPFSSAFTVDVEHLNVTWA